MKPVAARRLAVFVVMTWCLGCKESDPRPVAQKAPTAVGGPEAIVSRDGGSPDPSQSPANITSQLSGARDAGEVVRGLEALGVRRERLDELAEDDALIAKGHALFEREALERAETFRVNLDGDAAKEYVSQVILAPEPDRSYRERRVVYFIAFHDERGGSHAELKTLVFDERRCDEFPERPLTFRFDPLSAQPARHRVVFERTRISACGVRQRSWYRQRDTLVVSEEAPEFRAGTPRDHQSFDFGGQLDDILESEPGWTPLEAGGRDCDPLCRRLLRCDVGPYDTAEECFELCGALGEMGPAALATFECVGAAKSCEAMARCETQ